MTGSTRLFFKPKRANYIFESGDKKEIILVGLAEHPSFSKDMEFVVEVHCVGDDFKEKTIKIPDTVGCLTNKEETCYGDFKIWRDPDVPRITVKIYFRLQDFERLAHFIDKCFFSSKATMNINFTIANIESGYGPQLDKIPIEKMLPIIGYTFSMNNFENCQITINNRALPIDSN